MPSPSNSLADLATILAHALLRLAAEKDAAAENSQNSGHTSRHIA